jgi:hypothetical protein
MSSEDRWTYPAEGETSKDIDAELTDAEVVERKQRERSVSHPQEPERHQGLSSDAPGVDPKDRDVHGGQPTFQDSQDARPASDAEES